MGNKERRGETRVLAICCFATFMVGIDGTAVNIALPAIHRDLDTSIAGLQWTVDAYTVVLASMLLLGGSLADRLGRKRIFVLGISIFTIASLLCSLAPGVGALIAFRVLQAIGASMLTPVGMSIVTNTFTDPRRRAHAIGYWNVVFGIGMALGPVIGGLSLSAISWRAIFWINVPVGIAGVLLARRFIPESRAERPRPIDLVGQLLTALILATITFGIIEAPARGWTSPLILATFATAAVSLAFFIWFENRQEEPLVDPSFFRSARFSSGVAIAVLAFAAFGGFLFLSSIYLQQARGLSPLAAGLATLPIAIATIVAAPVSGRLVARYGPRVPIVLAGACLAIACAMLIGLSSSTSLVWVLLSYAIFGLGFGAVNPPVTFTAVSGMPAQQAGVASGITSAARQVGQAFGVAVVGAIIAGGALPDIGGGAWFFLAASGAAIFLLGVLATGATVRPSHARA